MLDGLRNELGLPNLNPEVVNAFTPHLDKDVAITLTEEQARKSGAFDQTSYVQVNCGQGSMNKYMENRSVISRGDNGEVMNVSFKWVIADEDQIIQDWIDAGSPEEWLID